MGLAGIAVCSAGTAAGFVGIAVDFAETVGGFDGIALCFDRTAADFSETVSLGIGIVAAGAGFVGTAAAAADGTEEKSAVVKISLIYLKLKSSCWLELLLLLLWLKL